MENDFNSVYPPKPYLEKEKVRRGHFAVTVFSIVLFAIFFLILFDSQVVFLAELLSVLIIHEFGHYLLMKKFGYQNVRMLFVPLMGAFVHGSKETYKQRQSILVILAGPIPGILFAAVLWNVGMYQQIPWMIDVSLLSFVLNILNLLPILPMDGGRLLNVLFFHSMELFQLVFSFISSLGMIFLGFWLESYVLMIFGFLMGIQVRGMHRRYLVHRSLRESDIDYTTTYENLSDQEYHFIKREVIEHTPNLKRYLEQTEEEAHTSTIVAGEVNNILEAPQERDASIWFVAAVMLIWIAAIAGPLFMVWRSGFFSAYYGV